MCMYVCVYVHVLGEFSGELSSGVHWVWLATVSRIASDLGIHPYSWDVVLAWNTKVSVYYSTSCELSSPVVTQSGTGHNLVLVPDQFVYENICHVSDISWKRSTHWRLRKCWLEYDAVIKKRYRKNWVTYCLHQRHSQTSLSSSLFACCWSVINCKGVLFTQQVYIFALLKPIVIIIQINNRNMGAAVPTTHRDECHHVSITWLFCC